MHLVVVVGECAPHGVYVVDESVRGRSVAHRETRLEKNIKRRLKAFGGPLMTKRIEWLQPTDTTVPLEAALALNQARWTQLRMLGAKTRTGAAKDLVAIASQQREWGRLWNDVQRLKRRVEKAWQTPSTLPNWDEIRTQIQEQAADRGLTDEQVTRGLRAFASASASDAMRTVEWPTILFARQLGSAAALRDSAFAAGEMAEAVANVNLAAANTVPSATTGASNATAAVALINSVYTALKTGRPRDVLTRARKVEGETNRMLRPLVDAAAYYASRDAGIVDMVRGRRALDVGNALRATFFARAVARAAAWIARWPTDSPFFIEWQAAASSKAFESRSAVPTVTPISNIVRSPSSFEGAFIAIEGMVGPISVVHRGQKVISSTSLTDDTGAHIRVGIDHIKIDSGGLVMGTYARIAGRFSATHESFATPVLVPDRRNLTDDSATSWFDWAALQLLPVLSVTPHNLQIETSWSLGRNGPGNLLRYRTWASNQRRRIRVD
jgi:hypothetical protein